MEIFEKLPDEINHLVSEFSSTPVVGDLSCGITQYSFWLIVSTIVLLIVLAVFKKKQTLVPKGFFVNGFEYIIEYVENDIGKGVVGENWKKHFPFLCSLFLFILINNMIGLIPGMKPGTGAIGSTAALAIFAFVYFIYYGCKAHGVIGYIKSLAPQGVSFPMNVLVWVVEPMTTCPANMLQNRRTASVMRRRKVEKSSTTHTSTFIGKLTPCGARLLM